MRIGIPALAVGSKPTSPRGIPGLEPGSNGKEKEELSYFVYILAHKPKGAIYVGSARDLRKRIEQHQSGAIEGHTKTYNIKTLVYFEYFDDPKEAITREYRIKKWRRTWKDELVEKLNPEWRDISADIPL